MKRTHKLRVLGDLSAVMANTASVSAAARQLGVTRRTVQRWIRSGAIPAPSGRHAKPGTTTVPEGQTPEQWAATVRADFELTATESVLLDGAVLALAMSRDSGLRPSERLLALSRFQALVKQLELEADQDGKETPATRTSDIYPRRVVS